MGIWGNHNYDTQCEGKFTCTIHQKLKQLHLYTSVVEGSRKLYRT